MGAAVAPVRAIPTSRAYWELRAEQVMNNVFSPDAAIDVEICETPPPLPTVDGEGAASQISESPIWGSSRPARHASRQQRPGQGEPVSLSPPLILASVSITVTLLSGLGLIALNIWNQNQQAIRQERNMLMIERLRSLGGPAEASGTGTQAATLPAGVDAAAADSGLPPPPPAEPWMEELATLPASGAPPANVLKVPMSSRVGSPAPPASGSGSPGPSSGGGGGGGDAPQLVGVLQAQGHGGSAIFQIGNASTSATVGESIGSSGWRLLSAQADYAVIERNGEQRRVSISGGS
jgi:hypothetical protein